jgi:hypothetical protein
MTYALGRRLEYTDMASVRSIVNRAAKHDHRISVYVLGVVNSPAFRMSGPESSGKSVKAAAESQ